MYLKANNVQRFCAYLFDTILIGIVYSLVVALINQMIGFNSNIMTELYSTLMSLYKEVLGGSEDAISRFYQAFFEYLKYYGLILAIGLPVYLVIDLLYLVILPLYWSKQTVGRAIMGCKVVSIKGDLNYKRLLLREIVGTFIFYQLFGALGIIVSIILVLADGRSLVDHISKCTLITTKEVVGCNNDSQYDHFNGFNQYNDNHSGYSDYQGGNDNLDSNDSNNNDNNASNDNENNSDDEYRII